MKIIQFKQQKIECELTDLEKLSSAITFITCALDMLKTINRIDLDATNGATIFGAIKMLQFQKIELNDTLDDLKIIEGREPWDGWQ